MQQAGNDNEKQRENLFLAVAHKSRSLQSSALAARQDLEESDFRKFADHRRPVEAAACIGRLPIAPPSMIFPVSDCADMEKKH
ncbi:hypothetical protein [Rhizobium herbae]|uniref:Uncharacterized protein n=1 Tax=Rhizobium herbae TaxID=508661 RepID=A0ABS4ENI1_9HYPH|nr:hypothetical protein [Rhizobium herbae]MBP1859514.1 hypothetical protein [Rhizobium herbae]